MKSRLRWVFVFAAISAVAISAAALKGILNISAATASEGDDATAMMGNYEAEQRAAWNALSELDNKPIPYPTD